MGAWDGAIEEYRAATSLDPKNSVWHSNLSAALASAKRFDEARNEASAALQIDPRNARAHFVMAGALLQTPGHLQEVVSHLVAAQDAFPSARTALEKLCAMKTLKGCP
jgi:tetratricopeptide (TPR) repeat protein